MTRSRNLGLGVLAIVLLSGRLLVSAQEPCCGPCAEPACEPRLEFLDDLWCLGRTASHRDPFEERIETDRHDFTQATTTVGHGVAQVFAQAGYSVRRWTRVSGQASRIASRAGVTRTASPIRRSWITRIFEGG